MWYLYLSIQSNTTKPQKGIKICHCNNMDGLGGYYVKWNNLDRERQILYNVIYMWNIKN